MSGTFGQTFMSSVLAEAEAHEDRNPVFLLLKAELDGKSDAVVLCAMMWGIVQLIDALPQDVSSEDRDTLVDEIGVLLKRAIKRGRVLN